MNIIYFLLVVFSESLTGSRFVGTIGSTNKHRIIIITKENFIQLKNYVSIYSIFNTSKIRNFFHN